MIELPTLYPHQEDLRDRTRASLKQNRRVILCAGCGVGKTRIAKWILGSAANREKRQNQSGYGLFVVQGRPLVANASNSFRKSPELPHGIIMSGSKPSYGARTQVASIDTLLSWFIENGRYDTSVTFDIIVYDETDNHLDKLKKFLKYHEPMRSELGLHPTFVIGPTASPQMNGLSDVYRDIVNGPPTEWLISNGFLSPFQYFGGKRGQLDKLVMRGGEYTKKSEYAAMDGLAGDLVRDWKRFAEGRPTVGFFPRRLHAYDAMHELRAEGVRAEYVDCETPDETRARLFWELNNHLIDYLCNVDLVGRGTDIPAIACIQLCVAIGSARTFIQKVGRGSRVDDGVREDGPNVPAKVDCIVIDHGPNIGSPPGGRHGFFEDERHWSLDRSSKVAEDQKTRPTIECPNCSRVYRGGKCSNCGYEPTKRERKSQGLDFDGTELRELKAIEREKKAKQKSAEELMVKALYQAGRSGRTWKQAVGMFYGANKKQGTNYRVPKRIEVGGHSYTMLKAGDSRGGFRVEMLYPFTASSPEHGGQLMER